MSFFNISMSGGILILGIVIVRSLLCKHMPGKIMMILWGVALVRLWLPFSIPVVVPGMEAAMQSAQAGWNSMADPYRTGTAEIEEAGTFSDSKDDRSNIKSTWLPAMIWVMGTVTVFSYMLIHYLKDKKLLDTAIPSGDISVFLEELRIDASQTPKFKLLISDRIMTPVTYGILSPTMVVPKEMFLRNQEMRSYALTHEAIHIQYRDNLWKFAAVLTVCLHWFNPCVWALFALIQRDMEMQCDEEVIRRFGIESRSAYAFTLLALAEQKNQLLQMGVGFGKMAVKERIEKIMKYKKTTLAGAILAVIVITASLTAFLTLEVSAASDKAEKSLLVSELSGEFAGSDEAEKEWLQDRREEIQAYADQFAQYGLSVTFTDTDYQFYFEEEQVCFVADNRATDGSFSGTVYANGAPGEGHGSRGAITIREGSGPVTGMKLLSEEETLKYIKW